MSMHSIYMRNNINVTCCGESDAFGYGKDEYTS